MILEKKKAHNTGAVTSAVDQPPKEEKKSHNTGAVTSAVDQPPKEEKKAHNTGAVTSAVDQPPEEDAADHYQVTRRVLPKPRAGASTEEKLEHQRMLIRSIFIRIKYSIPRSKARSNRTPSWSQWFFFTFIANYVIFL